MAAAPEADGVHWGLAAVLDQSSCPQRAVAPAEEALAAPIPARSSSSGQHHTISARTMSNPPRSRPFCRSRLHLSYTLLGSRS